MPEWIEENHESPSQNSQCPAYDMKRAPSNYKSKHDSLCQLVQLNMESKQRNKCKLILGKKGTELLGDITTTPTQTK
jgi:hypothetical protein